MTRMKLLYRNADRRRLLEMSPEVSLVLVVFVMIRLLCRLVRGLAVIVVLLLKRRLVPL